MRRTLLAVIWAGVVLSVVRADQAADLASIHVEAIGGRARLEALHSLRATGRVIAGDSELSFEMIAARPNLVRVTTRAEGRVLIQGYDGSAPPWRWEPGSQAHPARMAPDDAAAFVADADFDDPLVDPAARGYTVDYAGEAMEDGHRMLRLLITQRDVPPSTLVLDGDTYMIVRKEQSKRDAIGRPVKMETRYGEFRTILGVILPESVEVRIDGKRIHRTELDHLEANPELPPDAFAMPAPEAGKQPG